ncbi:thyrotropin-releasing hormone-degrading ectoenzyme-like [Linepithema humile]|uniref:thyrotropin-releasing hormone-degrading ectoenzyme-like n=1 Tax=Linepithema humile TaxID=83485 RepID=UPI0006233DCA|nr:PREDICTED: thyrotropin-releasing hormone-degrading ectoenzyme-like [Linepithema humile]
MISRKILLYGGLVLFATITVTLSCRSVGVDFIKPNFTITNNTKYEKIANNTKYAQISDNTDYEQIANDMEYEQIGDNTKYKRRTRNTDYERIANNTEYEQIGDNTKYEKRANDTDYERIANNRKYNTKYTPINDNLSIIVPLHYNSEIRFFFEDNILFGHCNIIINISQPLKSITMYSVSVYVMDAILIDGKNETVYKLFSSSFNKEKNILTLNFNRLLHHIFPDTFTLKMTYIRIMYENRKSFVRSAYQEKPEDQMLDQTGVEVMKARQLFPCEDEIIINSTFKIAIKHDEKYTILLNIPIRAQSKTDGGMMWTDFDESSMSAQQISIVITTFTAVSSQLPNVTVWCRQSAAKHVLYAINVIEEVLPYFKQKYLAELSKLDIVALWHPQDDVHAVTTLGLVLLREVDIIYNEAVDPAARQGEVTHMIARALVFLWCNNALLWSEEGFATFFAAYILDEVYQNNNMMDLLVVQAQQDSFRYDTSSVDFATLNRTNTSEVKSLGSLNYVKSFIVWRMLYHVIPDIFWNGIRTYIDKCRIYSNKTTLDDLWTIMQTIHKETYPQNMLSSHLKQIIQSWISKEYYPLLNVTQNYWNVTLAIDIQSFYPHLVNDNIKTWIPVTLTTQSSLNFDNTDDSLFWLTTEKLEHPILGIDKSDWIVLNIQQTGYYRVQYDLQNWHKLVRYLNSEHYNKVHILNRAQMIDDAFYFFLQSQLNYEVFWNLTNVVHRDTNFVTWYPLIKAFEKMTCIFPFGFAFHTEYNALTQEKIKERIDGLLSKIGYYEEPTEHTLTTYLRQEAIKWACILDIFECRRTAATELSIVLENSVENSYLRNEEWIYCYGVTTASHDIWYKIWEKWNATSDERFLQYLTCSKDSTILCDFLKITVLKEIRSNESKQSSKLANTFLLVIAKNAQRDAMQSCFFEIFKNFTLSSNRRNDLIATLIVIITHMHREDHMAEIIKLATRILKEELKSIKEKLKKRRLEFGRLVKNYGYYFSL